MAIPYSYDLRCKVLAAIDRGVKKSHASQLFPISRNTIDLWLARRATTGEVQALSRQAAARRYVALPSMQGWREFRVLCEAKSEKFGRVFNVISPNETSQNKHF